MYDSPNILSFISQSPSAQRRSLARAVPQPDGSCAGSSSEQCAQLSGAPPPAWPCYAHALYRRGNTSVKLFHYVACSSGATLRFDWCSCPERRYEAYAPPWPSQAGRGRPALAGRQLPDPGSPALQCLERRLFGCVCSAPWPSQACASFSHIGRQ